MKNILFTQENYKDDQNGLIHPENYWWGQGRNLGCYQTFNFHFYVPNIIFKVLPNFGVFKDNEFVGNHFFYYRRGVGEIKFQWKIP